MNYWWVNQNQTFKHEFEGGYLWSPKVSEGNRRNPFYDFMKIVRPGDVIFSFSDTRIKGFGIACSHCYTSPKPDEFGRIGTTWDDIGWRVDVNFRSFENEIRPKDHINILRNVLPVKYSPLQINGNGNQGLYLTRLTRPFAETLIGLIGTEARQLNNRIIQEKPSEIYEIELKGIDEWEDIECQKIDSLGIPETERKALIKARMGQGRFKENVFSVERHCRVTNVCNPVHLIASHIKPWRESNNEERLAAGNGLLLTPTIDHLFDRGFISFDDSGDTLISPVADSESLIKMGIDPKSPPKVGSFGPDQRFFLNHHRKAVFLK